MQRVQVVPGAEALTSPLLGSVVTAGTFDGVHLGHRALVDRAVARARMEAVPAVAYTFDPHPAKVLAPTKAPVALISVRERVRLLGALGIDLVVVEPFDVPFSQVTAEAWIQRYLVDRLAPRHVVVGFNFSYGRGRVGDPQHLLRAGAELGFSVDVLGPVLAEGEVVSSSRLRAAIERGEVELAARLLGRPFALIGAVVQGEQRGRLLGFPTANLSPEVGLLPLSGVYAGYAELDDGARFRAVTNIGGRPTFHGAGVRVESHLLGFEGQLYGRPLRIELHHRLREERRFEGAEALAAQIRADVAEAVLRLEERR